MNIKSWNIVCAAALIATTWIGCADDTQYNGTQSTTCDSGDSVVVDGNTYCVYAQNVVVEEGFRCPEGFPFQHEQTMFSICSSSEQPPGEGDLMDIQGMWEELHSDGSTSNGTLSNGNTSNGTTPTLASLCSTFCGVVEQCDLLAEYDSATASECTTQCEAEPMNTANTELLPCATEALSSSCNQASIEACLSAVSEATIASCLSDNPGDACPGTPPVPTCETVINECEQSGANASCEPLITQEAAFCIAAAAGLANGLEPWTGNLVFNSRYQRPIWSVMNLEENNPDNSRGGSSIAVDAVTGSVLGLFGWSSTP